MTGLHVFIARVSVYETREHRKLFIVARVKPRWNVHVFRED